MGSTKGIRALNKEPIEEYVGSKKGKWALRRVYELSTRNPLRSIWALRRANGLYEGYTSSQQGTH
jgi:hypothetical protein